MCDNTILISDISRFRGAVMGVAIAMIMLCHNGLLMFGDSGVEIFLIVSGLGISFSLNKKPTLLAFYSKRVVRVLPAYLVCCPAYYYMVLNLPYTQALYRISTFAFWTDFNLSYWFIAAILFYYLVSPLLAKLKYWQLAVLITLCLVAYYCKLIDVRSIAWVVKRFPSFIAGMMIGKFLIAKRDFAMPAWLPFAVMSVAIAAYCIAPMYVGKLLIKDVSIYLVIAFSIAFSCAYIACKSTRFNTLFAFLGSISLELYLTHQFLFLIPLYRHIANLPLLFAVSAPLAVALSYMLHLMQSKYLPLSKAKFAAR